MEFVFDCAVCGQHDIRQPSEPQLKYVVDKVSGRGASLQCCRKCAEQIEANAKAEREKAAAGRKRKTAAS